MSEYRSIGEVLAVLEPDFPDITISKIRFLESQGLLHPARTPAGYRQFCEADVEQLRWVLIQQRDHFLPLRVLRERINSGAWRATSGDSARSDVSPIDPDLSAPTPSPPSATESMATNRDGGDRGQQHQGDVATTTSTPRHHGDGEPDAEAAKPTPRTALDLSARKGKHGIEAVARQAKLEPAQVRELAHYGIIEAVENDPAPLFDDDAIVIAKAASAFMAHGVEPRHLKAWRTSADREASLFEQLTVPLLRQGSDSARSQAIATAAELVELGGQLRYAMLRRALRNSLGRVASA